MMLIFLLDANYSLIYIVISEVPCVIILGGDRQVNNHRKSYFPKRCSSQIINIDTFDSYQDQILAPLLEHVSGSCCVVQGSMLYVFGGWIHYIKQNKRLSVHDKHFTAARFNIETNEWYNIPGMLSRRDRSSVFVIDDLIYLVGGTVTVAKQDGTISVPNRVDMFDEEYNKWTTAPSLPETTVRHGISYIAGCSLDKKGFVIQYESCYLYEYQKDWPAWQSRAKLLENSQPCNVLCGHDKKLYAVGGTVVQCYDTISDQWTRLSPMLQEITICSAVQYRGKLYIIDVQASSKIHIYDIVDKTWKLCPITLAKPAVNSCATVVRLPASYLAE